MNKTLKQIHIMEKIIELLAGVGGGDYNLAMVLLPKI